jgi:hypothetical protein
MPTIINQFDVEMPNPARPAPGTPAAPGPSPSPPASRMQPVAVRDLLAWMAARERRLLEY